MENSVISTCSVAAKRSCRDTAYFTLASGAVLTFGAIAGGDGMAAQIGARLGAANPIVLHLVADGMLAQCLAVTTMMFGIVDFAARVIWSSADWAYRRARMSLSAGAHHA